MRPPPVSPLAFLFQTLRSLLLSPHHEPPGMKQSAVPAWAQYDWPTAGEVELLFFMVGAHAICSSRMSLHVLACVSMHVDLRVQTQCVDLHCGVWRQCGGAGFLWSFGHLFAFKLLALALPLFRADFSSLQRHTGKKSMQVTGQPALNAESWIERLQPCWRLLASVMWNNVRDSVENAFPQWNFYCGHRWHSGPQNSDPRQSWRFGDETEYQLFIWLFCSNHFGINFILEVQWRARNGAPPCPSHDVGFLWSFGHLFAFKLLALALPLFRADFSNLQRHTGKKSMQVTGQPALNAESWIERLQPCWRLLASVMWNNVRDSVENAFPQWWFNANWWGFHGTWWAKLERNWHNSNLGWVLVNIST